MGHDRVASSRRSFVGLTPPLAPTGWANTLTRSSSRRQPSSTTAWPGRAAPQQRRVVVLERHDLVHPPAVAADVLGEAVEAERDRPDVAGDVVEPRRAGHDARTAAARAGRGGPSTSSTDALQRRRGQPAQPFADRRRPRPARRRPAPSPRPRRPGASRRTSRCSSANASASHGSVVPAQHVVDRGERSSRRRARRGRRRCAAIARRPAPGQALHDVAHRRRRRQQQQPPDAAEHHAPLQVGVRQDAQRHARVVVEQRRVAGRGDPGLGGRHDLRQRADVPRHHPPPLVDRRRRGDRLARRRGEPALDRRRGRRRRRGPSPSASATTTFIRRCGGIDRAVEHLRLHGARR